MKKDDQISFASNRLSIQKFKVVLVGDQNAGKSSILIRYIKNEFDKTNNVRSNDNCSQPSVSTSPAKM
jgi:GTPase SAR1 family protein